MTNKTRPYLLVDAPREVLILKIKEYRKKHERFRRYFAAIVEDPEKASVLAARALDERMTSEFGPSKEHISAFHRHHYLGESLSAIAVTHNVTRTTILRWCRKVEKYLRESKQKEEDENTYPLI